MRRDRRRSGRLRTVTAIVALAMAVALMACAPHPEPIVYGEDVCAHCRMVIADERYGAELVTTKGRVLKFDSIECLADYVLHEADAADIHSLWVTGFEQPRVLIRIEDAIFLHSPALRSPMGANLTAFHAGGTTAAALLDEHGGAVLEWDEVLRLVELEPPGTGMMHDAVRP
ncbi:MAG TPA: nitrous oxide reductase accessory protein NosL [Longimicrobiales bacterium]